MFNELVPTCLWGLAHVRSKAKWWIRCPCFWTTWPYLSWQIPMGWNPRHVLRYVGELWCNHSKILWLIQDNVTIAYCLRIVLPFIALQMIRDGPLLSSPLRSQWNKKQITHQILNTLVSFHDLRQERMGKSPGASGIFGSFWPQESWCLESDLFWAMGFCLKVGRFNDAISV